MPDATANIIELLNRYELELGSEASDGEMAVDASALREYVARLLVQPPIWITSEYADILRRSVGNADWHAVAREQALRIEAADTLQAGSRNQGASESHPD